MDESFLLLEQLCLKLRPSPKKNLGYVSYKDRQSRCRELLESRALSSHCLHERTNRSRKQKLEKMSKTFFPKIKGDS